MDLMDEGSDFDRVLNLRRETLMLMGEALPRSVESCKR